MHMAFAGLRGRLLPFTLLSEQRRVMLLGSFLKKDALVKITRGCEECVLRRLQAIAKQKSRAQPERIDQAHRDKRHRDAIERVSSRQQRIKLGRLAQTCEAERPAQAGPYGAGP